MSSELPEIGPEETPGREPHTVLNDRHRHRPDRIGPYRILKVLGEGGMGTVYLAQQTEPIRRQVALKLIRAGLIEREVARRFEAERQALARMNHPNIAQVLEAGTTEDGRPYFVMEYVAGLPITDYCDQRRLTVRGRLELCMAICEGAQHAHQKGIVHRDIKPSNVLVAPEGGKRNVAENRDRPVPKVIDFGVAKALDQPLTEKTLLTGDRLIGTPAYLSPEAILASDGGMDVDTRTDVYSLGVLLYELLAGVLPFDTRGGSFVRIVYTITEKEAPSLAERFAALDDDTRMVQARRRKTGPRALGARLRGDLEWISMKAIAKDRTRRYPSAAELAADVERSGSPCRSEKGCFPRTTRTHKERWPASSPC